jgi:hypothetical protein
VLVLVRLEAPEPAAALLGADGKAAGGGAREAGVEAKGGDAPAVLVLEELEVVEGAAAVAEALEDGRPAGLVLVAVGKLDVRLRQGLLGLGELLEADDGRRLGAVGVPRVVGNELAADARGERGKGRSAERLG